MHAEDCDAEGQELLLFLNEVPYGIAQFDATGEIHLMNASFVRMVMQMLQADEDIDVLPILDGLVPGLAALIRFCPADQKVLCEAVPVPQGLMGRTRQAAPARHGLWVSQLSPGHFSALLATLPSPPVQC